MSGLFQKGQSGNPSGRPKIPEEIREMARAASPRALERAIELMGSADENVSLKAINTVLDRAYGKPATVMTGENGEGAASIVHEIRRVLVRPDTQNG